MKLSKLLLAVVGATMLLGALVSTGSARNLSFSSQSFRATWTRWDFFGSFGTQECEIVVRGSFHTRSIAKVVGTLIGYITEANINRCFWGSATLNRGSLPWHRRYRSFVGTLPNITGFAETITGAEWTIREPTFGITCTVRRESSSTIATYTLAAGGVVTRADISGRSPCGSFTGSLSGSTTAVDNNAGTRITVTLI